MNRSPVARHASLRTPAALFVLCCSLAAAGALAAPVVEKSVRLDPGLYELVAESATGTVYVASAGARGQPGAKVIALDGATLERKAEIDVTAAPLYGLGFNEATGILYGTATRDGVVSAVDVKSGKVVATIQHGEKAHVREAIVDTATNRAYVSVVGGRGGDSAPSAVWVIDGKTNTLVEAIEIEANALTGIALDPATQRLFGTAMSDHEVVVFDLAQKKVTARWPAGAERPTNIVFDGTTQRLFVANQSGSLSVLDARDGKLLKNLPTGEGALSVAYYPEKQQIYVANRQAGTTTVVDAKDYSVLAQLQTGTLPQTIAIDRRNGRVYVSNKARGAPRNAPAGTPVVEDANGDTVTLIRP